LLSILPSSFSSCFSFCSSLIGRQRAGASLANALTRARRRRCSRGTVGGINDRQRRTTNDQFDVGRQCDNRFRITVQESRLAPNIGLDDWGVAHLEVGTIHTRLGGQPVKAGEDDIWQLNRLGKLQGV